MRIFFFIMLAISCCTAGAVNYKIPEHKVIKKLTTPYGPYLLVRGRECSQCDATLALFIVPDKSDVTITDKTERYFYPGDYYNPINDTLAERANVYFGDCLLGTAYDLVWRTQRIERGVSIQAETYTLEIDAKHIDGVFKKLSGELKSLRYFQQHIKEGVCHQLPGMKQYYSP